MREQASLRYRPSVVVLQVFDPIIAPLCRLPFSSIPASFNVDNVNTMFLNANAKGGEREKKKESKSQRQKRRSSWPLKQLLAAEIFLFFFFLKASSSLPLQFLLVSETGVEREFLIVADAPELGVRVLGVAELESGGLLFWFFTMTVDGKQ